MSASRVRAEVVVVEGGGDPFAAIARTSHDSSVVLLGLRPPRDGETRASYADYFDAVFSRTDELPQAVFASTARHVPFKSLFNG